MCGKREKKKIWEPQVSKPWNKENVLKQRIGNGIFHFLKNNFTFLSIGIGSLGLTI